MKIYIFVLCCILSVLGNVESVSDQNDQQESGTGHAIQVVKIIPGTNGTSEYQLQLQAITELLTREDVADKPVALVSIAGPFRGGKSFLLNFFLRYLNAPVSKQKNGEWLGKNNETLDGFYWRGGSKRETTGINMWSEPFHVKLEPSGEEVVVLLMDTQGTFDSKSSLRDSTTIFAMSTLLSSVQIYNLFRNIDETDLHNLNLFTDYGIKAGNNTNVFQQLQFLIRDWPNPYEYPYGYAGGNAFLAQKLEVTDDQIPELRTVRENIRSSFRNLSCFLMPHPGLKVASKIFKGTLADIDDDFKTSLLELIPALFSPTQLALKNIGDQTLTGRAMLVFFEKYTEMFNSEALPPISSILDGVATAALVAAEGTTRLLYKTHMEKLDKDPRSFSQATLLSHHNAARTEALNYFTTRKLLGAKENSDAVLNRLLKDIDQYLGSYQYNNNMKLGQSLEKAHKTYKEGLLHFCGVQDKQHVCLHPADLEHCHEEARTAALREFESLRSMGTSETDEEKSNLGKEFNRDLEGLREINVKNNERAVSAACTVYTKNMRTQTTQKAEWLRNRHQQSLTYAKAHLADTRNLPTNQTDDIYLKQLVQKTDEYFQTTMRQQNYKAFEKGLEYFNEKFTSRLIDYTQYSPSYLEDLYDEAQRGALDEYDEYDEYVLSPDNWRYRLRLSREMSVEYNARKEKNNKANWRAVDAALRHYNGMMDEAGVFNTRIENDHYDAKRIAIDDFYEDRYPRHHYGYCIDYYCDNLVSRINWSYDNNYASFWTRIG